MVKEILSDKKAKKELFKGIKILGEAVGSTLGPHGNLALIGDVNNFPHTTKDGITVARSIELENPFQNAGAKLLRESSEKMLELVGDATTTSTVIAYSLINMIKNIPQSKSHDVISGINKAEEDIIRNLEKMTKEISDDEIYHVAKISANNDEYIASLINEAFKTIGRDGVISIEDSMNASTTVDVVNGMRFERGYLANHFNTDYVKDMCVLENPYIFIYHGTINRISMISELLNNIVGEGRSVLLIADDYDNAVLETLKINKLQGNIKVCPIKSPSYGEYRKSLLEDIACLVNGHVYDPESDEIFNINGCGTCDKVTIDKHNTTIYGGKGDVDTRVAYLKEEHDRIKAAPELDGTFMLGFLKERIAKLSNGIACIYVGGNTESEQKERKDRIDDAVHATQAAIDEGIVPGGGYALFESCYNTNSKLRDMNLSEKYGYVSTLFACITPIYKIAQNAGCKLNVSKLSTHKGFDAKNRKYCNVSENGIIDPSKAVKLAVKNALSIAKLFLNTNYAITPSSKVLGYERSL